MDRVGVVVSLIISCTLAGNLRADLSPLVTEPVAMIGFPSRAALISADVSAPSPSTFHEFPLFDLTIGSPPIVTASSGEPFSGPTFTIPPSPSSLMQFLSGMLAIGAWDGIRVGRRMAIGAAPLPEWYHDGALVQIGHAAPFDLQLNALSLCSFEQPVGEHAFLYRASCEQVPLSNAYNHLVVTAPRGPPAVSRSAISQAPPPIKRTETVERGA